MSKFYGAIGYSVTEEIRPGVWGEKITVRDIYVYDHDAGCTYDSYELSNSVQYCWLYVDDKIYQRN